MKALLIADDDLVIDKLSTSLQKDNYDVITYRWLIKAMDNIEEIEPDVIIINASNFPRHWKTLVQFVQTGITKHIPKIILYTEHSFSDEDLKKANALNITNIFNSLDENGLKKLSDFLSNKLNKNENRYSLIFTQPNSGAFIFGKVFDFEKNIINFLPDSPNLISSLQTNQKIFHATFKNQNSIEYIKLKVISKNPDNKKISFQVI